MTSDKSSLEELISALKQERDELRVRIHLAGMEGKEEYARLSTKIDELTAQYEPMKDALADTAGNVFSALMLAAGEMKTGFSRIRKELTEK
jgi:hypothetical protein